MSTKAAPSATSSAHIGQGRAATTILTSEGDIVHVVTDVPYTIRSRQKPPARYRGCRPMHKSTLRIPTQRHSEYSTSTECYQGRYDLPNIERTKTAFIPRRSQISFAPDDVNRFLTKYTWEYNGKKPLPPAALHYKEQINKLNMNEGIGMKQSLNSTDRQGAGTMFSQYNRVHNKLGAALGPGVTRDFVMRRQYDPLTGEEKGAAWGGDYKRVSGNRVLYHHFRRPDQNPYVLG